MEVLRCKSVIFCGVAFFYGDCTARQAQFLPTEKIEKLTGEISVKLASVVQMNYNEAMLPRCAF